MANNPRSHTGTRCRSWLPKGAAILALALLVTTIPGLASAVIAPSGTPGGFEIDGNLLGTTGYLDWFAGTGTGVLTVVPGTPDTAEPINPDLAFFLRDPAWPGNATDSTIFQGQSNKNNDCLVIGESPWHVTDGSGPGKNDITEIYATVIPEIDPIGGTKLWLIVGASTRRTDGDSHLDIEYNLLGLENDANDPSLYVGNGPYCGRSLTDFILSVDFVNGGVQADVTAHLWDGVLNEYVLAPSLDAFAAINQQQEEAPADATADASQLEYVDYYDPLQFVEIAVDITTLGITPGDLCSAVSTLTVKTRSSQEFTAELKDYGTIPFTIVQPPPCSISGPAELCEGDDAQYCAPDVFGYTYTWTLVDPLGGETVIGNSACVDLPNDLEPGTYTLDLEICDADGCCSSCSYEITVNAPPPCDISGNLRICEDGSTELCGPAGDYSYLWSLPGGGSATTQCVELSGLDPGSYPIGLMVTDNVTGCESSCEATLVVDALPPCEITGDMILCEDQSGEICGPEGDYSWVWTLPGGGSSTDRCLTVGPMAPGSYDYSLEVTDNATGCVSTCQATVTVNPLPPCEITGDLILCEDESGEICGPEGDYSWAWTLPDGGSASTRCLSIGPMAPGSYDYSLEVTDNVTGCTSTCEATVTVNPLPPCEITGTPQICVDGTSELCGPEGDYSYLWTLPGGGSSTERCVLATHGTSGVYNYGLQVTDNVTGCVSTCDFDLTVVDDPVCEITADPGFEICDGESTQLCGPEGEGLLYEWTLPDGSLADTRCIDTGPLSPGSYDYALMVTDPNGCVSNCEATVTVNELPPCEITGPEEICEDSTDELCGPEGDYSYVWTLPDGGSATERCIEIGPLSVGEYLWQLTVIDNVTGCESSCEHRVSVRELPSCDISGPDVVCIGDTWTYTAGPQPDPVVFAANLPDNSGNLSVAGAKVEEQEAAAVITYTYLWEVSCDHAGGAEIFGPFDGETVDIHFNGPVSCTITLTVTDDLGCETSCTFDVVAEDCGTSCPKTVGYWGAQCAQRGNGSTKFTVEQLTQIAECADATAEIFDWNGNALDEFCMTINPDDMDQRIQAKRQFAGVLANVCTTNLGLMPSRGDSVRLLESTPVDCAHFDGETIGEIIAEADAWLVELEGQPLNDVKSQYAKIISCLDAINNGVGIGPLCGPEDDGDDGDEIIIGDSTILEANSDISLYRPFPNPFTGETRIAYAVTGSASPVRMVVYDLAGRKVKEIVNATQSPGRYVVTWDGRSSNGGSVARGVYYVRTLVGAEQHVSRIVYLR